MATFNDVFQAIKDCDFDKFKELIDSDKSLLQYIDNQGNNLLMIFLNYTGVVRETFIENGTYSFVNDYEPNKEIFNYLVKSGIDLNHFNNVGKNALYHSRHWDDNHSYMQFTLIDNGADPLLKNQDGWSFLEFILFREGEGCLVEHIYKGFIEKQKLAYQEELEQQKQYYEQKLIEQKEQLLDELYRPDGLGYTVAKQRFEKND